MLGREVQGLREGRMEALSPVWKVDLVDADEGLTYVGWYQGLEGKGTEREKRGVEEEIPGSSGLVRTSICSGKSGRKDGKEDRELLCVGSGTRPATPTSRPEGVVYTLACNGEDYRL